MEEYIDSILEDVEESVLVDEEVRDSYLHLEFDPETVERSYVKEVSRRVNGHFYETQNLDGETLHYGVSIRQA